MDSEILLEACRVHNHLNNSFLNINDAKSICLGALWHNYNWYIRILTQETIICPEFLNAKINFGAASAVDNFWELDSHGVGDCFEYSEGAKACLSVTLRLNDNNLCEYWAIMKHQIKPVDETSLVTNKNVPIFLFDLKFTLLPFGEIETVVLSVVLFLNIVEGSDIHEQLCCHLVVESFE